MRKIKRSLIGRGGRLYNRSMIKFLLLNSDRFYRKLKKRKVMRIEIEYIDTPAYYFKFIK